MQKVTNVRASLLVCCLASACGGEAVPSESLAKENFPAGESYRVRYQGDLPTSVFLVVSTDSNKGGAELRRALVESLRSEIAESLRGRFEPTKYLDNPQQVDVFVFSPREAGASLRAKRPISWRESDATPEGASAFANALEHAVAALPDGEGAPGEFARTISEAVGMQDLAPSVVRQAVLVSTSDDPAPATYIEGLRNEVGGGLSVFVPAVLRRTNNRWGPPGLAEWARRNSGWVQELPAPMIYTIIQDALLACMPFQVRRTPDGLPSCRVLAEVPRGTFCDPARGWRVAPNDRGTMNVANNKDLCEVLPLPVERCVEHANEIGPRESGWCVPPAPKVGKPCGTPYLRFSGKSAPPFALLHVTCDPAL